MKISKFIITNIFWSKLVAWHYRHHSPKVHYRTKTRRDCVEMRSTIFLTFGLALSQLFRLVSFPRGIWSRKGLILKGMWELTNCKQSSTPLTKATSKHTQCHKDQWKFCKLIWTDWEQKVKAFVFHCVFMSFFPLILLLYGGIITVPEKKLHLQRTFSSVSMSNHQW